MKSKSLTAFRKWAYVFYGLTLLAFLVGLIPALFMGNIVLTGISAMLVLVAALLSLIFGRIGFRESEKSAESSPESAPPGEEGIQYTPLDPEEIIMDEANWLYTRGGSVHHPKHPPQHPR